MEAWRAHMDDQAEEDVHHEDASSIDSVDSTRTGSVDSGLSTASEARQPLFSAAAWRGLMGRVVRHASKPSGNVNWMLQGATDLPLLSRPGDVDNGPISTQQPFAGQPWPPSNPGDQDRCNWHWMHYISPRIWHYQIQTTSIFSTMRAVALLTPGIIVPPLILPGRGPVVNPGGSGLRLFGSMMMPSPLIVYSCCFCHFHASHHVLELHGTAIQRMAQALAGNWTPKKRMRAQSRGPWGQPCAVPHCLGQHHAEH